jgi:cytochrome P450
MAKMNTTEFSQDVLQSHAWLNQDTSKLVPGPLLGLVAQSLLRRYEPKSLSGFAVIPAAVFLLPYTILSFTFFQSITILVSFLIVLVLSILYYRLLSTSHPLHHIPGPVLARSTQLYQLYQLYLGRPRVNQQQLHDHYGPVVRIGPNEVSICDAPMLQPVFGGKPWQKGTAYSFTASGGASTSETALSSIRDHDEHKARRRIWDRAFSIAALKNYQPGITLRVNQLLDQFDRIAKSGEVVDLQEWIHYLVFDIMTDLAWGGGGDATLKGRDPDGAIASLRYSLHLAGLTKALPWFAKILIQLPWVESRTREFKRFAKHMFETRAAKLASKGASSTGGNDVFHHLLGEGSPSGSNLTIGALQADSRQVVTGGADTTVSAITYLFYQLLCSLTQYKQLQAALDLLPRDASGKFTHEDLAALPLLDAYIYEAMRLQPPIPYQNQRIVPAGGVTVSNIFIPGGTNTRTAIYALSRSSSNFTDPDTFIPERWLSKKDQKENTDDNQHYRFNPKASLPFLTGPYHCVGRNFAMQEMRYSVAALVSRYDMRLADEKGFNREEFENLVQDRSVLEIEGELRVIIKRRET